MVARYDYKRYLQLHIDFSQFIWRFNERVFIVARVAGSRIICRVRLSHTVIYSHRTNQFQFLCSFSRFFQHFKRLFSSVPPKWWQQSLVIFPLNLSLYESVGITEASPFHNVFVASISFIDVSLWSVQNLLFIPWVLLSFHL